MKSKWLLGCALLAAVCLVFPAVVQGQTFKVYALTISASGLFEDDSVMPAEIIKPKITQDDLANIALGQAPGSALPANTVLAWAFDCANSEAKIVVFNTQTQDVVVEVASSTDAQGVVQNGKGTAVIILDIKTAGDSDFKLRDGTWALSGKFTDVQDCPEKLSATLIGTLSITYTDLETMDIDMAITKGKLTVGDQIGTFGP